MYLVSYSLDNISLMALTISVGFVVDDAIVVVENIHRHVEATACRRTKRRSRVQARSASRLLSISVSLIAVFIPLLFWAGWSAGCSASSPSARPCASVYGVVALTLGPMMAARFLRNGRQPSMVAYAVTERGFERLLAAYERTSMASCATSRTPGHLPGAWVRPAICS